MDPYKVKLLLALADAAVAAVAIAVTCVALGSLPGVAVAIGAGIILVVADLYQARTEYHKAAYDKKLAGYLFDGDDSFFG